jgi:hypothetical protein
LVTSIDLSPANTDCAGSPNPSRKLGVRSADLEVAAALGLETLFDSKGSPEEALDFFLLVPPVEEVEEGKVPETGATGLGVGEI